MTQAFCKRYIGGILIAIALFLAATAGAEIPAELYLLGKGHSRLDELVVARLKKQGIPPSARCSDEVFLRRVYLDVIGTLPTSAEVRKFLSDPAPDKRAKLIDELLERDEYAAYWGLKWGDLLRIKAEFPSNLWPNAVQAYDRWVRESLRVNKPYDRFVTELLTSSGSNFRSPPANFFRAFQGRTPRQIAENVALLFMGIRLDQQGLSQDEIQQFSAFFAKIGYKGTDEWKEEIVFFNPDAVFTNAAGQKIEPRTLDGKILKIGEEQDPREPFAAWLTAPSNRWFARAIVNRVWYWLMGRGLVQEPDDMRESNPPWSREVLDYLAQELTTHHDDLKHIYRLILNSEAYQSSSSPNAWNASDETGISHYRVRRLDAEVLLDAIDQFTGTGEKYTSAIPEPFTFLPDDQRAIEVADGSIELPFLEMFGRPSRNTSYESERSSQPNVFQEQHLLNSSHIQKKIDQSPVLRQLATLRKKPQAGAKLAKEEAREGKNKGKGGKGKAAERVVGGVKKPFDFKLEEINPDLVDELYLRTLSRFPTPEERKVTGAYLGTPGRNAPEAVCDIAWALINTTEFQVKH